MVYESVIEEAIIQLLQQKGYELIDENNDWILNIYGVIAIWRCWEKCS